MTDHESFTFSSSPSLLLWENILRPSVCAITIMVFLSVLALPLKANANPKYASIVMDADTGIVLSQRYADKSLHPASLTKMMTLLLVFEALDEGTLSMYERIPISRRAASMQPSKLGLEAGSSIRVKDAILSLVTKSANDIAVAIAEHLGGTESQFAQIMTRRGRDIGMTKTTFRNASGLYHSQQKSTARDMAKLSRYLIKRYPQHYKYFSTRSFTYRGDTYNNHNRLMRYYNGMDGLKTGYIGASGFNLAASAVRGNRRLIGVVFGGRTAKRRNDHMAVILDRGFSQLRTMHVAAKQIPRPKHKPDLYQQHITTVASLNQTLTNPHDNAVKTEKVISTQERVSMALQSGYFSEVIGEGDYDPAISRRIETGLLAMAAHKGEYVPSTEQMAFIAPSATSVPSAEAWTIQIGAYKSRVTTDERLREVTQKLAGAMPNGNPIIAPLRTSKGVLFRARMTGYDKRQAYQACRMIKDCLVIGPKKQARL